MKFDIVFRLENPPFGTETSERNLMQAAADEIKELRAALEPFANAWISFGDKPPDETTINDNRGAAYLEGTKITFGDLRRGHAALRSMPQQNHTGGK